VKSSRVGFSAISTVRSGLKHVDNCPYVFEQAHQPGRLDLPLKGAVLFPNHRFTDIDKLRPGEPSHNLRSRFTHATCWRIFYHAASATAYTFKTAALPPARPPHVERVMPKMAKEKTDQSDFSLPQNSARLTAGDRTFDAPAPSAMPVDRVTLVNSWLNRWCMIGLPKWPTGQIQPSARRDQR